MNRTYSTEYDGSLVIDGVVYPAVGSEDMTCDEKSALTARIAFLLNKYGDK